MLVVGVSLSYSSRTLPAEGAAVLAEPVQSSALRRAALPAAACCLLPAHHLTAFAPAQHQCPCPGPSPGELGSSQRRGAELQQMRMMSMKGWQQCPGRKIPYPVVQLL